MTIARVKDSPIKCDELNSNKRNSVVTAFDNDSCENNGNKNQSDLMIDNNITTQQEYEASEDYY